MNRQRTRRRRLIQACMISVCRAALMDARSIGVWKLSTDAFAQLCRRALVKTLRPLPDAMYRSWKNRHLMLSVSRVAALEVADMVRPPFLAPPEDLVTAWKDERVTGIVVRLVMLFAQLADGLVGRFGEHARQELIASELRRAALLASARCLVALPVIYYRALDDNRLALLVMRVGLQAMWDVVDDSLAPSSVA